MTISPATWERVEAICDRRAAQTVIGIIKTRARNMLSGALPMRACPKAAAIVERYLAHLEWRAFFDEAA